MTTDAPSSSKAQPPPRPYDITLSTIYRWNSGASDPVGTLRDLIERTPEAIACFVMGPKTARCFLDHPSLRVFLASIESTFACGTMGGDFIVRGIALARIRVRQIEEGVVLACGPDGVEVSRLSGALG